MKTTSPRFRSMGIFIWEILGKMFYTNNSYTLYGDTKLVSPTGTPRRFSNRPANSSWLFRNNSP